jgi:hypothetical protein
MRTIITFARRGATPALLLIVTSFTLPRCIQGQSVTGVVPADSVVISAIPAIPAIPTNPFRIAIAPVMPAIVQASDARRTPGRSGTGKTRAAIASPSPRNPWVGAKVAYAVNSKGGAEKRLQPSALLEVNAWKPSFFNKEDRFAFPFVGNLASLATASDADDLKAKAQELIGGDQGIAFGIAPNYRRDLGPTGKYAFIGWMNAGWRLQNLKDRTTDSSFAFNQGRVAGGAELHIGELAIGDTPATLSVEQVAQLFNRNDYGRAFGTERFWLSNTELTFILPLGGQVGLMVDGVLSNNGLKHAFRFGFLIHQQKSEGQVARVL